MSIFIEILKLVFVKVLLSFNTSILKKPNWQSSKWMVFRLEVKKFQFKLWLYNRKVKFLLVMNIFTVLVARQILWTNFREEQLALVTLIWWDHLSQLWQLLTWLWPICSKCKELLLLILKISKGKSRNRLRHMELSKEFLLKRTTKATFGSSILTLSLHVKPSKVWMVNSLTVIRSFVTLWLRILIKLV